MIRDFIRDHRDEDERCPRCRGRGWTWTPARGYRTCPVCVIGQFPSRIDALASVRVLPPLYDWQARGDL